MLSRPHPLGTVFHTVVQVLSRESTVKGETFADIVLRHRSWLEDILAHTGGIVINRCCGSMSVGRCAFSSATGSALFGRPSSARISRTAVSVLRGRQYRLLRPGHLGGGGYGDRLRPAYPLVPSQGHRRLSLELPLGVHRSGV